MPETPKHGDLRIWWIPQIPGKPFIVPVRDIADAKLLLDTLARYDQFQFENRIKPDYSNAGGLCVFEEGEWVDWYHGETGDSIDDLDMNQVRELVNR